MTRQETVAILTILAGNYESFAKRTETEQQVRIMIDVWHDLLEDLDYKVVLQSVKTAMINSPYPPTVHDIRKNAMAIMSPESNKTAIEAWDEAYRMICRGLYMTQEEFDRASEEVKAFFGNVSQVRELAQTDIKTVNSVAKGQFLKQYETLANRRNSEKLLPTKFKETINQLSTKMDIKQIER